jgi:hypothetical protein
MYSILLTKINLNKFLMKTTVLILILALSSFTRDSATKDPTFSLPPETQTGANTFGVTINGKVYVPRDPTGVNVGVSGHGMKFYLAPDDISWNELEVIDGASAVGFQIIIYIQNLKTIGVAQYHLHQSNYHNQIDSTPVTHIYFKIWDSNISNYAYYGSTEVLGEINITKSSNDIYSGNFSGKFVRYDNPNEFIQITDGRFDIGPGLHSKVFP